MTSSYMEKIKEFTQVNRQVQQSYKIQNKCTKINVMFRLAMNNKKCNYKEFNL